MGIELGELELYALFDCDGWKSRESMRFCGVFTESGLRKCIHGKLEDYAMELEDENCNIDEISVFSLNDCLKYGYVEVVIVDEEI